MSLPTLVVCNPDTQKSQEIESLVTGNSDLVFLKSVPRHAASEEISSLAPRLVWLELAPEPAEGIVLLETLKEHFPATYFLVSYETLDASLVKASMQKGAFDYLDASSANDQLSEVITRLTVKEKARKEALENATNSSERFTTTADRIPAYSGPINKMRSRDEVSSPTAIKGGLPPWLIPSLALILLAIMVALQLRH